MRLSRSGIVATVPFIGAVGAGGASLLAMGCCMGPAVLVTALSAIGLGPLLSLDMGATVPILYATVGLSLAGIVWDCRRARRWFPLAPAILGGAALLTPFHEALDVSLFYPLVVGGRASLLAAAAMAARAGRSCTHPASLAVSAP